MQKPSLFRRVLVSVLLFALAYGLTELWLIDVSYGLMSRAGEMPRMDPMAFLSVCIGFVVLLGPVTLAIICSVFILAWLRPFGKKR